MRLGFGFRQVLYVRADLSGRPDNLRRRIGYLAGLVGAVHHYLLHKFLAVTATQGFFIEGPPDHEPVGQRQDFLRCPPPLILRHFYVDHPGVDQTDMELDVWVQTTGVPVPDPFHGRPPSRHARDHS